MLEDKSLLAEENYESITGTSNDVTIDIENNGLGAPGPRVNFVSSAFPSEATGAQSDLLIPIREPLLVKETLTSVESRCYGSRPEHFDVGIRVIEAAQLAGLDINPMVRLTVGTVKKTTSTQKSTNSPYWDQYFVISFHQPRMEIFQKVITATVIDSKGLLKSDETIGSFSCDIGTVFSQPGHSFHRKWALVTDLETNEPRGYLKLDINVMFKGDNSSESLTGSLGGSSEDDPISGAGDGDDNEGDEGSDETDIEQNLLLPVGVTERQSIKLVIKIYRAYGLTRAESSVKKALNLISSSSSSKVTCDAYVSVSFAGLTGRTTTVKKSSAPVWNQQITFVEMFPTFFQNIKFEVKDEELGSDGLLATYYLPLNRISSDGQDGFLPTFGPTFINLYGAARENSTSEIKSLSTGLEEGVAYVGRLLIAITTEFVDLISPDLERLSLQNIGAFDESLLGPKKEFALFGLLNTVSRIDGKFADKPITLELNMGDPDDLDGDGKIDEADKKARAKYRGITLPIKPARCFSNSRKENAYYLPLDNVKPIMFHRFNWIDDTWRLFISNRLTNISRNLANGLADVDALTISREHEAACRLLGVLSTLLEDCSSFLKYSTSLSNPSGVVRLDQEKMAKQREKIQTISNEAMTMRDSVSMANIVSITQALVPWINEINELSSSLHITFPDIFLSMLVDGKRMGQIRLATKDLAFSTQPEGRGMFTATFRSILLRQGGRLNGQICSQADLLCWFGVSDQLSDLLNYFPSGYTPEPSLESLGKPEIDPPTHLKYPARTVFQSRVHLFQARSLVGADTTGLSDPYLRIYYDKCILVSHVEEKTLSPCWNELIIGSQISLIGCRKDIKLARLTGLVEVYDRDFIGEDELIGRATVTFDTVRFADEPYTFPRLNWFDVWLNGNEAGQLLMALEFIQISETDSSEDYPRCLPGAVRVINKQEVMSIPQQIRPTLSKYRLQVIFWGVRNLKRVKLLSVDKPKAEIEVGGYMVSSSVIPNYSKNQNFPSFRNQIELQLPDQEFYCPPLSIRVGDCRAFGRFTLVGSHLVRSLSKYIYNADKHVDFHHFPKRHIIIDLDHLEPKIRSGSDQLDAVIMSSGTKVKRLPDEETLMMEKKVSKESEADEIDWWMRYFTSKNGNDTFGDIKGSKKSTLIPYHLTLRVYPEELEKRFNGRGADNKLTSFPLKRGKFEDDTSDLTSMGIFKGAFRLYRYPWKNGTLLLDHLSNNDPIKVLVRVYIIRAYDVIPRDANGKADLYPVLKLGSQKIDDVERFVPNCLDPIFGRYYEFEASLPQASTLTISLKDRDAFSCDELIGKTTIDLEDRFYSDHRFTCGLPKSYTTSGPGRWRDSLKPSQILTKLCRDLKMSHLVINKKYVQVGKLLFTRKQEGASDSIEIPYEDEQLALGVLNSWKEAFGYSLVPEHVETRSLYRPDKPGVKQGKLEMWVDMFRLSDPRPPPVDITPRAPRTYELRLTVWNTKDVILDDDSIVSDEKMSDIYVKGWINDPKMAQTTDIHFRSVTGEGNFNWRFVFRFDLLPAEGVIVIKRKDSFFSMNSTELKLPCRLNLQVWDYDSFSGDDFLGCLPLNLLDFPRGARTAKECTLDLLSQVNSWDNNQPLNNNNNTIKPTRINLFKEKRIRGWWPFYAKLSDGSTELTGKLEADFELLTKEEADSNPVGLGREGPQPLDKPQRPDTSFLWFANPWKSFRYIIWSRRKWFFLKIFIFIFLFFFFLLFFYSLPGYTVKKIIGA